MYLTASFQKRGRGTIFMATKSFFAMILAVGAGIGVYQQANDPVRSSNPSDAEREIRAAAAAYAETFSKGDMDAIVGFWTDDADYVDADGQLHRGKTAITDLFKKNAAHCKDHTMTLKVASVKVLKPDVALEEGVATVKCPTGDTESNRYIAIWAKNNGKWQLNTVRDQESIPTKKTDDPLKELAWLVGDWNCESGPMKVDLKCRWLLNKRYLAMEYEVKKPTEEPTQVVVWIGMDPASNELRSWVFDSEGGNAGARWEREGKTWKSHCDGVLCDGRFGASLNTIERVNDDSFVWSSKERRIDGEPDADAEVKFKRTNQPGTDAAKESK